jgi:hypothetical protein
MVSYVKSVTFDCEDALVVAAFWAAALGSNMDEDSTRDRATEEALVHWWRAWRTCPRER